MKSASIGLAILLGVIFLSCKSDCDDREFDKFVGTWKRVNQVFPPNEKKRIKEVIITKKVETFSCGCGFGYNWSDDAPPQPLPGGGSVGGQSGSSWEAIPCNKESIEKIVSYSNGKIIYEGQEYEKVE